MFESASVAWVVESLPWHWQGDTRLLATKCIFVLQDGLPRSILYRSSLDPCKYSIEWLFENDLKKSSFDAGNGSYWIFYSFAQKKNYNQNMFLNMIHVQYYTLICVFCDIILQYHSIYPWMPRKKSSQTLSVGVSQTVFPGWTSGPTGTATGTLPVGLMVATLLRSSTRDRPPK